ncbi:type II toxin-antitoxin system VapC family toxin [Kitasatospora purpeofusca]|uniref:type II toxin-antitoxin system VapC family toxin n=1 Tax=Kitasatospora purpeofusca TaxID=67352 RepID=UPI0038091C5D
MSGAPLGVAVADTSVLLAAFNRKDDLHAQGAQALSLARVLIVSPMVMTELDHLLTRRAGEGEAVNAITRPGALAGQGIVVFPPADRRLYTDAEQLLRQYRGHELGLADAVNAVLARRLQRPAILSFDHHYRDVLAPPKWLRIEVFPEHPGH